MHESQQIAAEHHDLAAHAHRTGAEHHGKEDHLTGHENSRQVLEHADKAYLQAEKQGWKSAAGHGIEASAQASDVDIAALAYKLWEGRDCPEGSPDEDWFRAKEELQSRP
jgi:hypothetical protein